MTMPHRTRTTRPARRQAGFNLMEVLVALGLFTVGFVAVASIFPAGALLQRNAADDMLSRQVSNNAEAIVTSLKLDYTPGSPGSPGSIEGDVMDDDGSLEALRANALLKYRLPMRSYPTAESDFRERDLYWVPVVRQTNTALPTPTTWQMYVFVLKRDQDAVYGDANYGNAGIGSIPGLRRIDDVRRHDVSTLQLPAPTPPLEYKFAPGDQILIGDSTDNTTPLRVRSYNDSTRRLQIFGFIPANWEDPDGDGIRNVATNLGRLWYAPPADGDTESPTLGLIIPKGDFFN